VRFLVYFRRKESHQIQAIFDALLEALEKIAPRMAAIAGVAVSVTSVVCLRCRRGIRGRSTEQHDTFVRSVCWLK
jgi:hypothetical protein